MPEEKEWLVKVGEKWVPATEAEVRESILSACNQLSMSAGRLQQQKLRLIREGRLSVSLKE